MNSLVPLHPAHRHRHAMAQAPCDPGRYNRRAGVARTTRLATMLLHSFGIDPRDCCLGGRITALPAGDNATAVRQWLVQTQPEWLVRAVSDPEWPLLLRAFAAALRDL